MSIRRIVTVDDPQGRSYRLSDGPSPHVVLDAARPGFRSEEIWAVGARPLAASRQTPTQLGLWRPPKKGSLCRVVTFPPEGATPVAQSDANAFLASMGAPPGVAGPRPHPYMAKTSTLDFCLILEGRITLILDTQEVELEAGDTVIQRGTNHAWSNRTSKPCVMMITMVDGQDDA